MKRKGYPFGNERRLHKRKRIIVIAAEGEVTEPQYFSHLNSMSQSTVIVMVPNLGNGSDPKAVLKRRGYLYVQGSPENHLSSSH